MGKLAGLILAAVLTLVPGTAAAEWKAAETAHFRISSSGGEKQLIRFAQRLEGLDSLLRKATGTAPGVEPVKVRVILLDSVEQVRRAHGRGDPTLAGFYTVNMHGPLAVSPRNERDEDSWGPYLILFHEYAHHFMLQYSPASYPAWYVEGFAEIASTATSHPGGKMAFGKAASHRAYSLTSSRWIPVEKLLTTTRDSAPADADYYGQSWLLAHYLTFSEPRAGQLRRYLTALGRGEAHDVAAKAAFGDLAALDRDLRKYLDAASFPYRAVPIDVPPPEAIRLRPLTPGEADLVEETAAFRDSLDKDSEYLVRLRRKAARFPSDVYALQLLADAEYAADQYAASTAAVNALLAIDPTSVAGRVRKAMLLLEEAQSLDGKESGQRVAQARALIVAANRSAPDDPRPLVAYYSSFRMAGERPTKAAVDGLMQAVSTVPQDQGPRFLLAAQLASDGRTAEAIYYLAPLAFDPHASSGQKAALEMLNRLKQQLGGKKNDG